MTTVQMARMFDPLVKLGMEPDQHAVSSGKHRRPGATSRTVGDKTSSSYERAARPPSEPPSLWSLRPEAVEAQSMEGYSQGLVVRRPPRWGVEPSQRWDMSPAAPSTPRRHVAKESSAFK